jgi:polar amino acid transport system substrate-binding protein
MLRSVQTILATTFLAAGAVAAETCADGRILTPGMLTIATGNPAYYPRVMDDNP